MKFHRSYHFITKTQSTVCGLKVRDDLFDYDNDFCKKCFNYQDPSDYCVHKHPRHDCIICFEEMHEGIIFEWKLFNFEYDLNKFDDKRIKIVIKSDFIIIPTSNRNVRITMISRRDPIYLDMETVKAMAKHGNIKLNAISGVIFTEENE